MSVLLFKSTIILIIIGVTNLITHYYGYKQGFCDGNRSGYNDGFTHANDGTPHREAKEGN